MNDKLNFLIEDFLELKFNNVQTEILIDVIPSISHKIFYCVVRPAIGSPLSSIYYNDEYQGEGCSTKIVRYENLVHYLGFELNDPFANIKRKRKIKLALIELEVSIPK